MSRLMSNFLVDLPTPVSISYLWNFGSLLGFFLVCQILTGLFLALHFSGDVVLSFDSVVHIMRDVMWGWFIRVLHSNGASVFFMIMYLHIGRGLYYGSYSMFSVWMSGVTLFLLIMVTAFLGYVLPWGQMSFWAATVITNLLSAVPYLGVSLVEWVWGGFAVSNSTLTRFFSFHFVLPFIVMFLVIIHLGFLHEGGSGNPLGISGNLDSISFHPMFSIKDLLGLVIVVFMLVIISLLVPYIFMDSENFMVSNPLVTPVHIQPEWYFLFAYTILRSVPSKIGGVVALLMSVTILYFLPFFMGHKLSGGNFYIIGSFVFWGLVSDWLLLTWIGVKEVESPFVELGGVFSFLYFFLFLVMWLGYSVEDYILS